MIPIIKQEPIEASSETIPDIKPDTTLTPKIKQEFTWDPPNIKPEPIEHPPDHPPTKRQKTQNSDPQTSSLKGKSKLVKEEHDHDHESMCYEQQVDNCGICLLEQGVSVRGYINSCDHYFCFVCIMEWAKVESKCPICKRRFSSIKRPTKEGVFVEERVVNVPVRDQVHYFNGNATVGPPDLYRQIKCSFCNLSTDDSVLLLCDLCDSAAHTYCVGLGHTVPEEDWFCKDCTLSRDEHAKVETATSSNNNDNDNNPSSSNTIRFAPSDVSIHDIVRETSTREPQTPSVPASVPTSVNQSEPITEQSITQSPFFRTTNAPNARTLQRCRNVHSRIRILRENWNSFRGGSLHFSSTFGNGNKARPGQEQSSSENQESMSEKRLYNTDKAWKMMDVAARALGRKWGNKSSFGKDKFPIKNERLMNEASKVRQVGTAKNKMLEKNKLRQGTVKNSINHVEHGLPSSRKISTSSEINKSRDNSQNLSRKEFIVATSNVVGTSDRSSHLIRSLSIATDKCCAENEIDATVEKGALRLDKNIKEVENAKSEIQSLVKLNLKLLSKDNKLDVDVFKEVARHATHSIMAACDIEPPKARFRSFERLVCHHNKSQKRPSSSLMPTSCRECFFVFVKDVVTTIAIDRTGSCKA
nr:zinc finger, FYVE/PHD-type [Tanacetum cinerariifolium]